MFSARESVVYDEPATSYVPPQETYHDGQRALIEALVCEVHGAALNTAIIASAANALGKGTAFHTFSALEPFLPSQSSVFKGLCAQLPGSGWSRSDISFTCQFMDELPIARSALDDYFADVLELGHGRAAVLHQRPYAAAWRDLAHQASLAVDELQELTNDLLPSAYTGNARALLHLLAEAQRGGTPCLDSYGRISPPAMPQQRRSPRRLLCQECVLRFRDHEVNAFAKDVSAGGFGLERTPQLNRGEHVVVELASGRVFHGAVAWSSGNSAGLRFTTPLAFQDPLLNG